MELCHVGKELERDCRRLIDLELSREPDHETKRTEVIAGPLWLPTWIGSSQHVVATQTAFEAARGTSGVLITQGGRPALESPSTYGMPLYAGTGSTGRGSGFALGVSPV